MSRRDENDSTRPPASPGTPEPSGSGPDTPSTRPNAFAPELFEALRRRDHHPATPEADFAGPWRVMRLWGYDPPGDGVRWGCFGAGERAPRLIFQELDLAHLGAAGLALTQRRPRFHFQKGADGRNHLLHDGDPVATVAPIVPDGCSLPTDLTRLADLRASPQALAHFLLAVPDDVLKRAGTLVMEILHSEPR